MNKLIANDIMIIIQSDPGVACIITKTGMPSTKSKLNNNGIIKDAFEVTISNITYPSAGATIPDPVTYTKSFIATSLKDKVENDYVCRLGDKTGVINASPLIPGIPPVVYPISFTIDIVDAGQTKVSGE